MISDAAPFLNPGTAQNARGKPQKQVDGGKIFEVTSRLRASGMNDIPAMQQNILMVQRKE